MKNQPKKLVSSERRSAILQWLLEEGQPITGSDLARRSGVSRQVIVQDMSLLKAKGEPIFSTAQGYLYLQQQKEQRIQRLIAVQHAPEDTMDELYTFVDSGLTVIDVIIEHPIYGEITGTLRLSNRQDVNAFCDRLQQEGAYLLSQLTNGIHLHSVEADTEQQIERALQHLREKGYLVEE
ncbi:transcription repressor NadR [Shouchella lehensis]|uniref:Transcriptional regulator n=1 Tax=Shouchella lehensis G1 TaxID=1246626 RepID=A0A060M072_9BACI|nr:transcription repressor NadR [Shouchella lehensis]AIC93943.1 transcriptional regulator [Shouchella lehensis G1]